MAWERKISRTLRLDRAVHRAVAMTAIRQGLARAEYVPDAEA